MKLDGVVALITGGSQRIGRELALSLASHGATVAVHTNTSHAAAVETVRTIEREGGTANSFQADFSDHDAVSNLFDEVQTRFGEIRVLVNNASVFGLATLDQTATAQFNRHLTVNLVAPFILARAMYSGLKSGSPGKIINIGDWHTARPESFAYGVSKTGLRGLTRSLAVSMAPTVQVNQIDLGSILPPMDRACSSRAKLDQVPSGRAGRPDEVAQAMHSLIANDYITGQILRVDGGLSVW